LASEIENHVTEIIDDTKEEAIKYSNDKKADLKKAESDAANKAVVNTKK